MKIASNSIDPDGAGGALSTLGERMGIQQQLRSFGEIQAHEVDNRRPMCHEQEVLGENRVAEEQTWSLSELILRSPQLSKQLLRKK